MKTGIQVSSFKPLLLTEYQVRETFSEMHHRGWNLLQLQWIDSSVSVDAIAQILSQLQLESVSVQDFYETVISNLNYYTRLNTATGGKWLCVSRIPERLKSEAGLSVFIEELRRLQRQLEPLGQQVCFHPVSADYAAVPGMDPVQFLAQNMPELSFCLDLYHLNRNCSDMCGYIRNLAGRICMVHFKDSKDGRLVPSGQGDTDWTGVVQACIDAGVPYGFAEQETWDRDPFDCLQQAMDWLDAQL